MNIEEYARRWGQAPAKAIGAARQEAADLLEAEAETIRTVLAPFDEGDLAESIRVEDRSEPDEIRFDISAGAEGPSEPYASVQEERRDFRHRGGQKAGYIGDTVKERQADISSDVAAAALKGLGDALA